MAMTKTCLMVSMLLAIAISPATAQGRLSVTTMSCESAQATIANAAAIVLGTGPSTYDRFVATQGYCTNDEFTEPAFAPTANNPQCFIGYRCREKPSENKN